MQDIDVHEYVMPHGPYKGKRLVHVPLSYLRRMVQREHSNMEYAEAELKRRGSLKPRLDVSGHAVDRASLYCYRLWKKTRRDGNEGLHSWCHRMACEAMENGQKIGERFKYHGLYFVIEVDGGWPILKTIIKPGR
jgi:hypothetical protein